MCLFCLPGLLVNFSPPPGKCGSLLNNCKNKVGVPEINYGFFSRCRRCYSSLRSGYLKSRPNTAVAIKTMTRKIPTNEAAKKYSAIFSNFCSRCSCCVRKEIKERKQEIISRIAITEVNSSILVISLLLLMCKEVMTTRQNPSKLAAVFKM